jgi:chorismate mutase
LLEKRYDVIREIAKLKKNKNLPLRDAQREMEIIKNKCKLTHLTPHIVEKVYGAIIECSREIQGEKL